MDEKLIKGHTYWKGRTNTGCKQTKTNTLKKEDKFCPQGFTKDWGEEYAKIIHKRRAPSGQTKYEDDTTLLGVEDMPGGALKPLLSDWQGLRRRTKPCSQYSTYFITLD